MRLIIVSILCVLLPYLVSSESSRVSGDQCINTAQFYSVTPDQRDCMSPFCGGYWLTGMGISEGKKTVCADGTKQEACYVAAFDLSLLQLSKAEEIEYLIKIVSDSYVHGCYKSNPAYSDDNVYDMLVSEKPQKQADQQQFMYYRARLDDRDCASPLCGGHWLYSVNSGKKIQCPDNSVADECYVAAFDLRLLNNEDEREQFFADLVSLGIVLGKFHRPSEYQNYSGLYDLVVRSRWYRCECSSCDNSSEICADDPSDNCTADQCPTLCLPRAKSSTVLRYNDGPSSPQHLVAEAGVGESSIRKVLSKQVVCALASIEFLLSYFPPTFY